jgi:thiol-disulfide isomerase/thioredoxin
MGTNPPAGNDHALLRSLRGAIQGAIAFSFASLVASAAFHGTMAGAWPAAIFFALIGAVAVGTGRLVGRGTLGAVIGGLAGMLLGGVIADHFGAHPTYARARRAPVGPIEIAGPTVTGENFSSSQWLGKVVLVDFWATWCVPCIAELPNVREVYDRYHADGFEVVGISLDQSRESLERFVKKRDIPWPQIYFPKSNGWANPLVRKFGVHAIPATMLLDPKGFLAATEVRGSSLESAVAQQLGKKKPPFNFGSLLRIQLDLRLMPPGLITGLFGGCIIGSLGIVSMFHGLGKLVAKARPENTIRSPLEYEARISGDK